MPLSARNLSDRKKNDDFEDVGENKLATLRHYGQLLGLVIGKKEAVPDCHCSHMTESH